jgi:hypothetical protein
MLEFRMALFYVKREKLILCVYETRTIVVPHEHPKHTSGSDQTHLSHLEGNAIEMESKQYIPQKWGLFILPFPISK